MRTELTRKRGKTRLVLRETSTNKTCRLCGAEANYKLCPLCFVNLTMAQLRVADQRLLINDAQDILKQIPDDAENDFRKIRVRVQSVTPTPSTGG